MAGGFLTLPMAIMNVVGGVPVMPAGVRTIVENLRCAKSMIPGDLGGLLANVLQNGPGALLQNPIGAVLGQLNGQLGGIVNQIQNIANGNFGGLLSAITGATGLQSVLGNLSQVSNALSGLSQAVEGGFGLIDAIGHANIVSMLGEALPAGLGIQEAMGPLLMGEHLAGMVSDLGGIAEGIANGTLDPLHAISQVTGMANTITNVLDIHTNAFQTIQNAVVDMAHVNGVISLITSGPAAFAPIANSIIQPQFVAQINQAITNQLMPDPTPGPFAPITA